MRRYHESKDLFIHLEDDLGLAHVLDLLGYVMLGTKDIDGTVQLFEESLAICRKQDDKLRIANVLIGLASAVHKQGDQSRVCALLQEAKTLFERIGSRIGSAMVLASLAKYSYGSDAIRDAYCLFERSLEIYQNAGDAYHSVHLLKCLAQLDCTRGQYDRAEARIAEAIQRYDDGSGHQVRRLWFEQGKLALHRCDFGQAHVLTEQTRETLCNGPQNPAYPIVLLQSGVIAFHLCDDSQAEASFVTVLEHCHNVADAAEAVDAHNGLGKLACCQGNPIKACVHLYSSLNTLSKLDDWPRTAECLEVVAHVALLLERAEEAATLLGAAMWMREVAGTPLPPYDRKRQQQLNTALGAALSLEQFRSARAAGSQLTPQPAIVRAQTLLATWTPNAVQ